MPNRPISLRKAAEIVGVHHSTLARAVERGEIQPIKSTPAGWGRFSRREIERYARTLDVEKRRNQQIDRGPVNASLEYIPVLARQLTGADFAAVTVQEETGEPLRIYHDGMPAHIDWQNEQLPTGKGVLGKLGEAGTPLKLDNIADHPSSYGFPDWHPEMKAILGVRIANTTGLKANLYLANAPESGGFSKEDERILNQLTSFAELALDSANLYQQEREVRLLAEQAETRLQAIIEQSTVGLLIIEADTRNLLGASDEARRIFGEPLTPGSTLDDVNQSVSIYDANGRLIRSAELPLELALDRLEATPAIDLILERANGKRTPIVATATPIGITDGTLDSAVMIFQDVSNLKEVDEAKSEFLSMITHDLRSPLATIKGMAGSIRDGVFSDQDLQDGVDAIVEEVDHMTELVSNLLDMSRIESGTRGVEREICHMTDVVQDAVRRASNYRFGQNRNITVSIPASMPEMYADPGQLGRVFDNLISNALKYTNAEVFIKCEFNKESDSINVEVHDQGEGIPDIKRPEIFDKFYRVSEYSRLGREGSGLGLAICKSVIGAHGGTIGVRANEPTGSIFWFEIPRDPDQI